MRHVRYLAGAFLPALLAVTLLAGCDAADPGVSASVSGVLVNRFDRVLADAIVSFNADEDGGVYRETQTDAEGRFSVALPSGVYTAVFAAEGYTPLGYAITVGGADTTLAPLVSGPGTLEAQFVSALTGEGEPDILLQCARRNEDGSYPDPETDFDFSATSGEDGTISLAGTPHGLHRCRASGGDFDTRFYTVNITREGTTGLPPFVITPPPPAGALRIVLTWGQNPSDLDSHLTGPDGNGGRFHVYWVDRSFGSTNLDVDDTSSYGPETITAYPSAEGIYRYSIHNWSDQSVTGGAGIAASPARVEVHDVDGLVCSYEAEAAGQSGNTWRVFETDVQEINGLPTLVPPCARGASDLPGMGYTFANGADDLAIFRTGVPTKPATGN